MKRILLGIGLLTLSLTSQALDQWDFSARVAVTAAAVAGRYHHLEGAGRKHIAVSPTRVAVTWEDDRSGDPQVYLSLKKRAHDHFSNALQLSTGTEAYEPAIDWIDDERFITTWEQDGAVFARSVDQQQVGKPLQLSTQASSQISIAANGAEQIYCVWREQRQRSWNLVVARLGVDETGNLSILSRHQVEQQDSPTPVLFPSISVNQAGINIAWEDRQAGHTRLKHSFSADQAQSFSAPQYLNEFHSNRNQYDKGSGVTRVSLAAYGTDETVAAWMDKRRGNVGYGIFAALGSGDSFGPNEKVHGPKGDAQPHYNPATAGNKDGDFIVAWDDFRNGTSDIWISGYNDEGEWSKDRTPAPASGSAEQTHPSVALDARGDLHLLWIERSSVDAPTRLWYSHGQRK